MVEKSTNGRIEDVDAAREMAYAEKPHREKADEEAKKAGRSLSYKALHAPETMTDAEKLEWWGKDGLVHLELVPRISIGSLPDEKGNTVSFLGELYPDESAIPPERLQNYHYVIAVGGSGSLYGKVVYGGIEYPQDWTEARELEEEVSKWINAKVPEIEEKSKKSGRPFIQVLEHYSWPDW